MHDGLVVQLTGQLTYPGVAWDVASAGLYVPAPPTEVTFDLAGVGFVELPSQRSMLKTVRDPE